MRHDLENSSIVHRFLTAMIHVGGYLWDSTCRPGPIPKDDYLMSTDRDPYFEDNYEQALDAFRDSGWKAIPDGLFDKGYAPASQALREAAIEACDEDNQARSKVLQLLAEGCSMMLSPEKRNDPFGPFWVGGGMRSVVTDDFTEAEIRFFNEVTESIEVPLLKGRLADLVWVRSKSYGVKNALDAIDSYRQLPIDVDSWFSDGERCLQRAIDLSRMIGATAGERLDEIEASIIKALNGATAEDKFLNYRLAQTLMSNGLGESEATAVAGKLESLAAEFDAAGDFHASGRFYSAAAKWFSLSEDEGKAIDMTVEEAEAFVREATDRLSSDSPSHGVAASFVENAIQVYRTVPRIHRDRHDVEQRIRELRLRLSDYGRRALDEMATVSLPPIDVSDSITQVRNAVSGKSLEEAMATFTNLHQISAKKLREAALESLSSSSLLPLIPKVISTSDGRVSVRTPGISGTTPSDQDELEIRAEMNRFHYGPLVSIAVQALILPALNVLTLEHRLREIDFIALAKRSPIVPIGREVLFGKALAQGFNLDFATSLHLLTPQIENMVRFHLKAARVSTTHLDQDGIETENGLSALVDLPETTAIFGEDLTYEIKALFCDQLGPNLRNNVAHGLLDDQQAHSIEAIYAWWLALKLVFNTFWNSLSIGTENEQQEQTAGDDSL